jgi:hypothetical protein
MATWVMTLPTLWLRHSIAVTMLKLAWSGSEVASG